MKYKSLLTKDYPPDILRLFTSNTQILLFITLTLLLVVTQTLSLCVWDAELNSDIITVDQKQN